LVEEFARREITDLTSTQVDLLVEAVNTSPTRTAVRAFGTQMRSWAALWGELKAHTAPRWTTTPSRIADYPWREDQDFHRAAVHLAPSTQALLQRIYREIPLSGDQDNGLAVRDFGCWISIGSSPQDLGAVTVHTGKHVVGTLTETDSSVARRILSTQWPNSSAQTTGFAAKRLYRICRKLGDWPCR
jgi:hypothetical protein